MHVCVTSSAYIRDHMRRICPSLSLPLSAYFRASERLPFDACWRGGCIQPSRSDVRKQQLLHPTQSALLFQPACLPSSVLLSFHSPLFITIQDTFTQTHAGRQHIVPVDWRVWQIDTDICTLPRKRARKWGSVAVKLKFSPHYVLCPKGYHTQLQR